jgi:hypothetical protein
VRTDYASQLALRTGGRDLTEGAFLYKRGHLAGDAKSFNRAIGIFTNLLSNSADPLVALVARAYLQLAYYRSGRLGKVPSVEVTPLPKEFSRLDAEMRGLAWMCGAEEDAIGWQDGLGFADLSALDADRLLEEEIRAKIVTPVTAPDCDQRSPVASGSWKRKNSDVVKVAEEHDAPTELKARLLKGGIIYIPPKYIEEMHRDNYRQLSKELQRSQYTLREKVGVRPGMTECSYCGCQVKTTRLRRHLGRCPKYPKNRG